MSNKTESKAIYMPLIFILIPTSTRSDHPSLSSSVSMENDTI